MTADRRTWNVCGNVLTLHLDREIAGKRYSITYSLVDNPGERPVTNVPATAARGIIEKMDQFEKEARRAG